MIRPAFVISALGWLAAMAAISFLGPLGRYPAAPALAFAAGFLLMVVMTRVFPGQLPAKSALAIILVLAVAGRIVLLPHPPGNDIYRYIWEGHVQNLGFNPYLHAPAALDGRIDLSGRLESIRSGVNHPELPAIYPPAALLLFRILAAVTLAPIGFKLVLVGFDLALILLLERLRRRRPAPVAGLLFYAANPLVLVYIAGEGHLDGVQAFFLLLGFYWIDCAKDGRGFFMLGMAAMIKYLALAAWPFLIRSDNWKRSLACLLPAVLFVPFRDAGWELFHSLGVFGGSMHYNDSIAAVLRTLLGADAVLPAAAALLAVGWFWIFLFVQDRLQSVFWALGWMLLCLPTLHPWYLLLPAPFLVFYPALPWIYLQGAMAFTFPVLALELQTGVFQEIAWLKWFEYLPFALLLLWGLKRDLRVQHPVVYAAPRSVAVIVPTLNEHKTIEGCLRSIEGQNGLDSIVVADGGSTDGTRQLAEAMGAEVVQCAPGRGRQIRAGIARARAELLMILHADCRLRPGTLSVLLESLRRAPHVVGGAVTMRFDSARRRPRLIEWLNHLRLRLTGIAFGDQAQFVRREVLQAMGGFPDMMLMEDVELSMALKERGAILCMPDGVRVSPRRWEDRRFAARVGTVLRLFFGYLFERRWRGGGGHNQSYYERYYRSDGDS
jgi:rSAM/selenodomain-associated transferase 2